MIIKQPYEKQQIRMDTNFFLAYEPNLNKLFIHKNDQLHEIIKSI